jgi:hypothetical protein
VNLKVRLLKNTKYPLKIKINYPSIDIMKAFSTLLILFFIAAALGLRISVQ